MLALMEINFLWRSVYCFSRNNNIIILYIERERKYNNLLKFNIMFLGNFKLRIFKCALLPYDCLNGHISTELSPDFENFWRKQNYNIILYVDILSREKKIIHFTRGKNPFKHFSPQISNVKLVHQRFYYYNNIILYSLQVLIAIFRYNMLLYYII